MSIYYYNIVCVSPIDEETGLHQNYFRDYNAETGRYQQGDLIGLGVGLICMRMWMKIRY